jgi:amino acid adenylation domain-containing protein
MPIEESVEDRFARAARAHAERDAVRAGDQALTYASLVDLAARVAHTLLDGGIRTGDRVALFFDREPAAFAAVIGVLKTGAVVVPLVASHPAERLRQIIDDAELSAIVSDRRHGATARGLIGGAVRVVEIEDLASAPERDWPSVHSSSPALILYTSGSTGRPKGVLLDHGFILNKFDRVTPVLDQRPGDRIAMFGTYALGQGFSTMMLALLSGATLCPFDIRRDGLARLLRWLASERITIFLSSATLFRSLARTLDRSPGLADLRIVRVGGERVAPDDVAEHRRLFPDARFIVNYSSTETGTIAMYAVEPAESFPGGIVPLGRPLAGVTVQILDNDGRPLPIDEEGEIAVQCAHIASGYWRDAERTARSFAQAPGPGGHVVYRTGDLGRMRPTGFVEHLGRKDLRVKIRGFRIEIEEVETVLSQDPNVQSAAVAVKSDADGDLRLVAYVQLAPGSDATVEGLRARLGIRLPEHMIPSAFVVVDALPLTDSGKVARLLLPDPVPDRSLLSSECVLPRDPLEATIAAVWREVLGLETVGVHDSFLSIGGDSLKATLVASRLALQVGVSLPLWALFEASTIAELAVVIARHAATATPAASGTSDPA